MSLVGVVGRALARQNLDAETVTLNLFQGQHDVVSSPYALPRRAWERGSSLGQYDCVLTFS